MYERQRSVHCSGNSAFTHSFQTKKLPLNLKKEFDNLTKISVLTQKFKIQFKLELITLKLLENGLGSGHLLYTHFSLEVYLMIMEESLA